MAGVLDRLGLDGGPRESMFAADEFNSDGYWEQRPLVEMHDRMLQALGGFASAPPAPCTAGQLHSRLPEAGERIGSLVDGLFDGAWFVKDPRHCLLLPLWTDALGSDDLAVVVLRSPEAVVRSLQHRNGYSELLALGLWERYTLDLLNSLEGRPTVVVRYEELVRHPRETVREVAEAVERHVGPLTVASIDHAVELVRVDTLSSRSLPGTTSEVSREIVDVSSRLTGYHERFSLGEVLPEQSAAAQRRLTRRRWFLRVVGSVIGHDAISRSQLDRRRTNSVRGLRNAPSG